MQVRVQFGVAQRKMHAREESSADSNASIWSQPFCLEDQGSPWAVQCRARQKKGPQYTARVSSSPALSLSLTLLLSHIHMHGTTPAPVWVQGFLAKIGVEGWLVAAS